MRETIYVPNNGYITTDTNFEYIGNGLLDSIFTNLKDIASSELVKDSVKSFGTTLAKKAGENAANKVVDKISKKKIEKSDKKEKKKERVESVDLLKQIYGNSIFKQSGKGLNRL